MANDALDAPAADPATPPVTTPAAPAVTPPAATAAVAANGNPPQTTTPSTPALDGKPAETKPVAPSWREDWRDALAGGDDKLRARLDRMASPEAVFKSYIELDRRMSAGGLKPTLRDGATPEEVTEYRKAWGVPEKPEDYGITVPQGVTLMDGDKANISKFQADLHSINAPKAFVDKALDSYFKIKAAEEQDLYDAAVDKSTKQRDEMLKEYGRDYNRNTRLANQDMISLLGPEKAKDLASVTLADGTKLGDHPDFVRYMVGSALRVADDTALVTADGLPNGISVDDAYKQAIDLKYTDPKKYHSPEHQAYLTKLAQARTNRKAA